MWEPEWERQFFAVKRLLGLQLLGGGGGNPSRVTIDAFIFLVRILVGNQRSENAISLFFEFLSMSDLSNFSIIRADSRFAYTGKNFKIRDSIVLLEGLVGEVGYLHLWLLAFHLLWFQKLPEVHLFYPYSMHSYLSKPYLFEIDWSAGPKLESDQYLARNGFILSCFEELIEVYPLSQTSPAESALHMVILRNFLGFLQVTGNYPKVTECLQAYEAKVSDQHELKLTLCILEVKRLTEVDNTVTGGGGWEEEKETLELILEKCTLVESSFLYYQLLTGHLKSDNKEACRILFRKYLDKHLKEPSFVRMMDEDHVSMHQLSMDFSLLLGLNELDDDALLEPSSTGCARQSVYAWLIYFMYLHLEGKELGLIEALYNATKLFSDELYLLQLYSR